MKPDHPPATVPPIGVDEFGATILPDCPGAAVTGQSVRNWIREGMPGAKRDERGRWIIVDPDAARAWCERVKAETMAALRAGRRANAHAASPTTPPTPVSIGRGGARAGAGRKRTKHATPGAAWRKTELGAVATAVEPIIPPPSAATGDDEHGDDGQPPAINTNAERKLNYQAAKEYEQARKLKLANDLRTGELLERADVERTWAGAARAIQVAINGIAPDAAERVVLACALGGDARPLVVRAVQAAVDRAAAAVVKAMQAATPPPPPAPPAPPPTGPAATPAAPAPTPIESSTGDANHGEAGTEDRGRPAGGT